VYGLARLAGNFLLHRLPRYGALVSAPARSARQPSFGLIERQPAPCPDAVLWHPAGVIVAAVVGVSNALSAASAVVLWSCWGGLHGLVF